MNAFLSETYGFQRLYIKSFLNSMQTSVYKLFNAEFRVSEQYETTIELKQKYDCLVEVPFLGSVSGSFIIELDRSDWEQQFFLEFDLVEEKMFLSAIKELLNVASSISLESLRSQHSDIKILCPRIILGKIYYPEHRFVSSALKSSQLNPIYCHICFNQTTTGN